MKQAGTASEPLPHVRGPLPPALMEALAPQQPALEAAAGVPLDADAQHVFALSDFARSVALAQPEWFRAAISSGLLERPMTADDLALEAAAALAGIGDMPALQSALRRLRNRFQLRIVWRHLACRAALEETTTNLSVLADTLIHAVLERVHDWAALREGEPAPWEGQRQRMVVLALGKLGARELNLSSDVDLVFAYPEAGSTARGRTHQQFFVRCGQLLIQALDTVTADGFVFRVDMRLRPYGDSGPLAMSFHAMEDYFLTQGRDWERYAFIKARACAGDRAAGAQLLKSLRPFVFRRYLDFGAIDALRDMKRRILAERHHRDNIKLGPGGIRDVEFAAQVQQLIWGGRQSALQEPALLRVLPALAESGHLEPAAVTALIAAYRFLRDTEHCLQAENDQQTQMLPVAPLSRLRLAHALGFADVDGFVDALAGHRASVAAVFADLIAPVQHTAAEADAEPSAGFRLWVDPAQVEASAELGFADADAARAILRDLAAARDRSSVGAEGRQRLDRLMPALLDALSGRDRPDLALARTAPVLKGVMRRSAYLALLAENPGALTQLLDLAGKSRWVAEALVRRPAFLDSLLGQVTQRGVPSRVSLANELRARCVGAEPDGEERVLDVLRDFKEQHVFNVALGDVRGTLPLMNASDYLTFLAEAVLENALEIAWRENSRQQPGYAWPQPFVIVGYGKLGGIELGPGSDLDVVLLHDFAGDAGAFLHRLARRLLHVLTVPTYAGTLYDVDMRLRPSGNAGTMVSSIAAFTAYQREGAWTWEHQALVRARALVGDAGLCERFEAVRREILCLPRDPVRLREDVAAMRERMRHQGSSAPNRAATVDSSDLKRATGGMIDIEFIVQYLVLAHAHTAPDLAVWSDNVRILETAGRLGILAPATAQELTDAYLALRAEWHRGVLDLPDSSRAARVLDDHRTVVEATWRALFDVA